MGRENRESEEARAKQNAEPKPPRVFELGGDYYYRCYWLSCDETISRWDNYCRKCGQKIDWEDL